MVFEDILPLISSGNNVVEGAFKFYPWFARHEATIAYAQCLANIFIFKSDPQRLL